MRLENYRQITDKIDVLALAIGMTSMLGAEDVAKATPFFAFRNKEGVVEGVRYERLTMVLINAVKERQE